jgi:tRNA nucleotidyltransferase (CCA-adding enzyme)
MKDDVLKVFKPSQEEQVAVSQKIARFIGTLEKRLTERKLKAKVILGGSAAKGTFLSGDFDCDVFVQFDESYRGKDISKLLKTALPKSLETLHGSRDYYRLIYEGLNFEIIPVLAYSRNPENVTDMSPLHVDWIKKKIAKNSKLPDEIILTKAFCKAQEIYGAESYIGGLSGHVVDILCAYYGSFERLMKAIPGWKMHEVIDIEGYGTAKNLNKSKISPLILIDPVDPSRNAAAALTHEKFEILKARATAYNKKPAISFFKRKELSIEDLKRKAKGQKLLMMELIPLEGKKDIVGGKLLKAYEHTKRYLDIYEFKVKESGWMWNSVATFWFIVDRKQLSETRIHKGPPAHAKSSVERFMEKYPGAKTKAGWLYVIVPRDYRRPEDLLSDIAKSDYVKERVKKAKLL